MYSYPPQWIKHSVQLAFLFFVILGSSSVVSAQSQANAADLRGYVRDQQGAGVPNATVTATNAGTNLTRSVTSGGDGEYQLLNLPPGTYDLTVEAATFKKALLPAVIVTVGQTADLDVALEVGDIGASVTISGQTPDVIETTRTAVATTIDQQRIENLPINERNYLSFALTTSTAGRDNGRPIGPAPTSGLNFGGQRGRSNLVQVDGADNTDNSVNASRSTVSQEAVQEFQVVSNSFLPEFGRASGGVVNVVTKSGTNELHGNAFGFLRSRKYQARNPFAPIADPPFTRAQYGATLGGPIAKDRTFFFFAFERHQRNESGFFTSNVANGLNSSVTIGAPFLPFSQTFSNITSAQSAFVSKTLTTATPLLTNADPLIRAQGQGLVSAAIGYAYLASSGGNTALTGVNPLLNAGTVPGVALGAPIGSRFFLTGAPVPVGTRNAAGQPIAFQPLLNLQKIFPVTDRTNFTSFKLDHVITKTNQLSMRFGYNPSTITGIQVESQNQSLGQNDFSRTGVQGLKDYAFVTSLNSVLASTVVNEARFNFGERRATFKSGNGDAVADNIAGTAFIGRELFSPVIRTETRYEFTDNINIAAGNHNFKFGGDAAFVKVNKATFELNFAGLFNFGSFSAGTLNSVYAPSSTTNPTGLNAPDFTAVQSYGLGIPSTFIQGFGNPVSSLTNKPFAFFLQDSWKIRPNLTLNYGVRYDVELTQQIAPVASFKDPLSGITLSQADLLAAQNAVGVQQGFPRDKNNWAPRLALAWDPQSNGKTVIRAAYGLFYDHPLLAVAFNSDIADAAQQQQTTLLFNNPAPTTLLNAAQVFQGTVCTGSTTNPLCPAGFVTPGVAAGTEYQFGRQRFNDQTFPGFGTILPFVLPVTKDFEYAYAEQANFTVERELTKDMSLSASYLFVGAHHLPHPRDINSPNNALLIQNFQRFAGRAPASPTEAQFFSLPMACPGPGCPPGFTVVVPGILGRNVAGQGVVSPAAASFFRANAPNYFLVQALTGGAVTPAAFNALLAANNTLRTPGVLTPFGDTSAQSSDGNSNYNALNIDLKQRFAHNFQFLASYTWSHSIDDSSDLQTLLKPQDNNNERAERADSLFDQRHRFVFSAVASTPSAWRSSNGAKKVLADFSIAPIFEIASGRPFNVLSFVDTNGDQQSSNDRPNVDSSGILSQPAFFTSGTLGRNMGITHLYTSFDMRLTKVIPIGERFNIQIIAEGFNLFNHFNEAASSPLFSDVNAFGQRAGNGRYYSQPTASYDPRQFQFGLKLNF